MSKRDMTPDERRRFEEEKLHHASEADREIGPASEPEAAADDRARKPRIPVPPNPD